MKSVGKTAFKVLVLCIFLEVFIFNFKHFESYFFENIKGYTISNSNGLDEVGSAFYKINNSADAFFEINELDANVGNLYIDFNGKNEGDPNEEMLLILIEMTDEANVVYQRLPEIKILAGIKESKYVRLHLSGKSTKLKINILGNKGDVFHISSIQINKIRPLIIHPFRVVFLFTIIILYLLFRKKSTLYTMNIDYMDWKQKCIIIFVLALHITFYIGVGLSARPAWYHENDTWKAHAQYEYLADALISGQVYLIEDPPRYLSEMENPYDPGLRMQYVQSTGEDFVIDFAYFNGHYYCYFGIVPALMFFVPYKLLTGVSLQTWIPVVICALLYCVSSFFFVYQLIRKYYPKTSIGLYLIVTSVFIAGSQVLYLAHFSNVYSMPIMLALLFGVTGLGLWLKASQMKCMQKRYLVLGAICIALIAGCRPQLEIVLLFAFPIFWTQLKDKQFFSRKGVGNTCSIIVPFVIIAIGLMWYNFIRFNNPFDFGANYNLTSNDMTHRGVDLYRNFLGIFEYIIQPLNIKSTYPFMETIQLRTEYQGFTGSEPLLGGFFWMNIISVFSVCIYRCKNSMKEHKTYVLSWMSLTGAAILILLTIQMSGITQRYMSDFGWLVMISTILVILDIQETHVQHKEYISLFTQVVVFLAAISILTNYFSLFAIGRYADLINMNPYLFYLIKYMFFSC